MAYYDSNFFIKKTALINLFERFKTYIITNFPDCQFIINENSALVAYPDEYSRIYIYQNSKETELIIKITQNINKPIGKANGILFSMKNMDDLNFLKYAVRVVLSLKDD